MEISEKTSIRLPLPLFITVIGGVLSIGAVYFQSQLTAEQTQNNTIVIEKNEVIDRLEREKITKQSREDDEKLETRILDFMNAELNGLRADMDKEDQELLERIKELNK